MLKRCRRRELASCERFARRPSTHWRRLVQRSDTQFLVDAGHHLSGELLTPDEAARRLGVTRTTFYDWVGQSRRGLLRIHGGPVTIEFFQTGANGQGRIGIEEGEVERLRELMRVKPSVPILRKPPTQRKTYPHISVALGRPDTAGRS